MDHWHFILWSRAENTFTHYDSNRIPRQVVNLGDAKRAMKWATRKSAQYLWSDVHEDDPIFIQCISYPQKTNSKLDGGLYMLHGITFW
ncbi:hypothetical protein ZOSMA_115G00270 [Zostera marina]|uniref:Ubiquitin-like protease family profile domain-containing protein n=1 Tax=Zostera marina TaxID=29655 RepID=A0A0K9Q4E0_ZOSMR|nr:hypothetical protein ZOSMA_115G00270 [Zostera marina]